MLRFPLLPGARAGAVALALALVTATGCAGGDAERVDTGGTVAPEAVASSRSSDADLRDVARYELTIDKMEKYFAAMRNMGEAAKNLPPGQQDDVDLNMSDAKDLDDYAARIDRHPQVRDALRRAGLSAREFAMITVTYMQAAMAQAVTQMRPDIKNTDSLAKAMGANPANIRFVRDNAKMLETRMKALEAETKAAGASQQ